MNEEIDIHLFIPLRKAKGIVRDCSLLCLTDGEAEGEETDVRGAGTGHLRTGSSTMLLLSISSIMYSARREEAEVGEGKINEYYTKTTVAH